MRKDLEVQVCEFLKLDDNSCQNHGKKDCLNIGGEKHQTRVFTDYMYILFERYLAENLFPKIGKTSFYKMRPADI